MLQYVFCLAILFSEMALCSLIILPIPIHLRRNLLERISRLWNHHYQARLVIKFTMFIVLIMFLDAMWGIWRVAYTVNSTQAPTVTAATVSTGVGQGKGVRARMFEEERNAFLSCFILFLFMMIYRFQMMNHQLNKLEGSMSTNREKYDTQAKSYNQVLKETKELERLLDRAGVVSVDREEVPSKGTTDSPKTRSPAVSSPKSTDSPTTRSRTRAAEQAAK